MNLDLDLTNNQQNKKSLSDITDKHELTINEGKGNKSQQNQSKSDSQQDSYEVSHLFILV